MAWGRGPSDVAQKVRDGCTRYFVLPGRVFGDGDAEKLADAIAASKKLEELDLGGHRLSTESICRIGRGVALCGSMKRLVIGDVGMGDDGVVALCEGLKEDESLEELDLQGRGIGLDGVRALVALLDSHGSLRRLNLSRNPLGTKGAEALGELKRALEVLELRECGLSSESIGKLAGLNVGRLVLSGNDLGGGLEHWETLGGCVSVTWLEMEDCKLTSEMGVALGRGVAGRGRGLGVIRAARNPELGDGSVALARAWDPSQGGHLDLSGSGGSDELIEAICETLERCETGPASVDVGRVGARVGAALVGLATTKLRDLRLFGNPLTDLPTILTAITGHTAGATPTLNILDLGATGIDHELAQAMLQAVLTARKHPSDTGADAIRSIIIAANPIPDDDANTLVESARNAGLDLGWGKPDMSPIETATDTPPAAMGGGAK